MTNSSLKTVYAFGVTAMMEERKPGEDRMETIPAKTIVYKTKRPGQWFGADYNMNLYRGCTHGCIYCDSRSDCYRNPDFDKIAVKEDALRIVRDDLRRKVKPGVVATGAMSDPYNPLEETAQLTRRALTLLHAYGFGVAIDTKSPLVTRDVDLLSDIQRQSPVLVKMTVTTARDDVCRMLEPNVAVSSERFAALASLSAQGIFCGVLLMPVLPFINDTEDNIRAILRDAKACGARFVYPAFGVTLRAGNRDYFYAQLDKLFPGLSNRYRATFGDRYQCTSPKAGALWAVFKEMAGQLGLLYSMKAITEVYQRGYNSGQLSFF